MARNATDPAASVNFAKPRIVPEPPPAHRGVFTELCHKTNKLEAANTSLCAAEQHLRRLSSRLLQIQDAERCRIAREIHDGLGQYLVGVKMGLDQLARKFSHDPSVHSNVIEISLLLTQAINETRTISHLLYPPLLDEVGLKSALAIYADGFAESSGIAVTVDVAANLGRLESDVETALFRVAQECLLNVPRHSDSATASVTLVRDGANLRLQVHDEGVGMSGSQDGTGCGVGLLGIRERIRQLDGKLEIISGNGQGTTVVATIPNRPKDDLASPRSTAGNPLAVK